MERCQLFNNVLTYTHVQASVCIFKHGGFGLKGTAHTHACSAERVYVFCGVVSVFCVANMLTVAC